MKKLATFLKTVSLTHLLLAALVAVLLAIWSEMRTIDRTLNAVNRNVDSISCNMPDVHCAF